jgi:hypothetical protein
MASNRRTPILIGLGAALTGAGSSAVVSALGSNGRIFWLRLVLGIAFLIGALITFAVLVHDPNQPKVIRRAEEDLLRTTTEIDVAHERALQALRERRVTGPTESSDDLELEEEFTRRREVARQT